MSADVAVEVDAGVAVLTLNRPDHFNAYTAEMGGLLSRAYLACDADDDIRAIVVTGAGRAFCAGGPISPAAQALSMPRRTTAPFRRRRSPRPPSSCANR